MYLEKNHESSRAESEFSGYALPIAVLHAAAAAFQNKSPE